MQLTRFSLWLCFVNFDGFFQFLKTKDASFPNPMQAKHTHMSFSTSSLSHGYFLYQSGWNRQVKDSLLNLVPGYSGETGCFGTIVEDSDSSSAIPPRSDWMPLSIGVLGSLGSWTSLIDASGLSESWSMDSGSGWIFATDSYVDEIVRSSLSGLHPTSGASCVWLGDSTAALLLKKKPLNFSCDDSTTGRHFTFRPRWTIRGMSFYIVGVEFFLAFFTFHTVSIWSFTRLRQRHTSIHQITRTCTRELI